MYKRLTLMGMALSTVLGLVLLSPTLKAEEAPAFTASRLQAGELNFDPKQLTKPTLLVFWASWCQSCRYEIPKLIDLFRQHNDQLDIVGISIDHRPEKARDMVIQSQLPYMNVLDHESRIATQFQVTRTPSMILIDRSGQIRHRGHRVKDFQTILKQMFEAV